MKNDKRIIAAVLSFAMLIQPGSMGFVMAENQEGTETVSEEKVMNSSKLSAELRELVNSEADNIRIIIEGASIDEDELSVRIEEKIGDAYEKIEAEYVPPSQEILDELEAANARSAEEYHDLLLKYHMDLTAGSREIERKKTQLSSAARREAIQEYLNDWREEIFKTADIDEETADVSASKLISSISCVVNAEQVRKLSMIDSIQQISVPDMTAAPRPTVSPTEPVNKATSEPIIFDPSTPMPTHTTAPASPLPTNQNGAVYGDINDDKVVDISDLTMLSLVLIGDVDLTDYMKSVADFDGDIAVTIADLARLRQYLSKKIDSLTDDKDADTVVQEKEVKYSAAISVRVTDNKLDEYPQHSIIEDRAGFEALYNEKQSLEIEKTGFYSGGIFPILNDKYTDEWFETHKLYVAYPGKGGPTGYRYKVESVTNKAVTIYRDLLGESQSRTENKADWIILIEVAKDADVTEATEIKFNTVY